MVSVPWVTRRYRREAPVPSEPMATYGAHVLSLSPELGHDPYGKPTGASDVSASIRTGASSSRSPGAGLTRVFAIEGGNFAAGRSVALHRDRAAGEDEMDRKRIGD